MGLSMPRGNYKEREMDELPSDYLLWVAQNWDDEDICCAADEEYSRRTDESRHWYD
jgi:hypothetical protein